MGLWHVMKVDFIWLPATVNSVIGLRRSSKFTSVVQLCPTLWDPMDCSTPGFPVHHQLPELDRTHVHWVGDAIQPSHPLSSPSPPTFNLSQHQGLFQWVGSLHHVAKVLALQLQQSVLPVNIQGWFHLGWTGLISLLSKGLSKISSTTVRRHQFFSAQPFLLSSFHICTWLLEKSKLLPYEPMSANWCLCF